MAGEGRRDRANPAEAAGNAGGQAGAALFLASPPASYVVGQTIVVDGGLIL
jgi:3-oxoacyl-[acyl-carrier protein] reductase